MKEFLLALLFYYPCAQPIGYKLGTIDPKFNLNEIQVKTNLLQAEGVWEKVNPNNLFVYDDQAKLTVNFVYDTRQELKNQINKQEAGLKNQESSLETQIASFKQQLATLNNEINTWNSKGGAPPEEYDKLIARQKVLRQMAEKLNQKSQSYDSNVLNINKTIDSFNQELSVKPEEGLYSSADQTISIFFILDKNELIHTLAHEFGHARGLDHIDDSVAIMYPKSSNIITPSPSDITALESVCRKRSYWDVIWSYAKKFF